MLKKSAKSLLVVAILAASGCASFPERDPALDNARLSLDAARRNPQVVTYAPAELDQAMAQAGIQAQPVTAEDQQAMAAAEAADPNPDEEVEEPE